MTTAPRSLPLVPFLGEKVEESALKSETEPGNRMKKYGFVCQMCNICLFVYHYM